MDDAAAHDEDAEHDGAEARAVPRVVVVGALPQREAVGQEVVVAVPRRPAQDVCDEGEAGLALRGALDGRLCLGGRGLLGGLAGLCAVVSEVLLHLVRVERARLLAVGAVDVLLRGRGGDAEDVVKGGRGIGLVRRDFIADAEDFSI